jgi:hypothetical protein
MIVFYHPSATGRSRADATSYSGARFDPLGHPSFSETPLCYAFSRSASALSRHAFPSCWAAERLASVVAIRSRSIAASTEAARSFI